MYPETLSGLLSFLCFSLPVFTIFFFRLYRHAGLLAIMGYYLLYMFRYLCGQAFPAEAAYNSTSEVLFNFFEIPLTLSTLLFFCPARHHQLQIRSVIAFFVAYEAVVALLQGFTPAAGFYVLMPGLPVIVLYAFFLFRRQLQFTIVHRKNTGRVLMLAALLVPYCVYWVLFGMDFLTEKNELEMLYKAHLFAAGLAALIMSIGLYLIRHRIRDLQELKVTRSELRMVFGG